MKTLAKMVQMRYKYAKLTGVEFPADEDQKIRKIIKMLDTLSHRADKCFNYIFSTCKRIDKAIEKGEYQLWNICFLFYVIKNKVRSTL